jgi:hypothetical protein
MSEEEPKSIDHSSEESTKRSSQIDGSNDPLPRRPRMNAAVSRSAILEQVEMDSPQSSEMLGAVDKLLSHREIIEDDINESSIRDCHISLPILHQPKFSFAANSAKKSSYLANGGPIVGMELLSDCCSSTSIASSSINSANNSNDNQKVVTAGSNSTCLTSKGRKDEGLSGFSSFPVNFYENIGAVDLSSSFSGPLQIVPSNTGNHSNNNNPNPVKFVSNNNNSIIAANNHSLIQNSSNNNSENQNNNHHQNGFGDAGGKSNVTGTDAMIYGTDIGDSSHINSI